MYVCMYVYLCALHYRGLTYIVSIGLLHNSAGYKKEKYLNLIDIVIPVELKLYFILKLCSQSQNCSIKCHMIKLRDRAFRSILYEGVVMKVVTLWNTVE